MHCHAFVLACCLIVLLCQFSKTQHARIRFSEKPGNISTVTGARFMLKCNSQTHLYASATWTKDGQFISTTRAFTDGRMYLLRGNSMLIVDVEMADSGVYTCRLSDGFHVIEARAWVDVSESDEPVGGGVFGDCGIPLARGKIHGGRITQLGEWPWMAMLYSAESGKQFCGGTVLNRQWVLTAAHCIHLSGITTTDLKVYLGKYNADQQEENERVYDVAEVILFPDYNVGTFDGDVALLRLEQRVAYTDFIIPICLPTPETAENMLHAGKSGWVTGWGDTEEEAEDIPNLLREVRLEVVDHNLCGDRHVHIVTNNMFCAGPPRGMEGRDACSGDSGGPYVKKSGDRFYLLGIVSWGVGCATPNLPGVYTAVHRFYDWIRATSGSGEESCVTTEENYEERLAENEVVITKLEETIASMTSEMVDLEDRLATCGDDVNGGDGEDTVTLPPVVEGDQRKRCINNYCSGSIASRAICVSGYCQCLSPTYDTHTCLPVIGGCSIRRNAGNSAATASVGGAVQDVYSCRNDENNEYEVHVIGVYEAGPDRSPTQSTVHIEKASHPENPIILVLVTFEPIHWIVEVPNDVTITRTLLMSYNIDDTTVTARGGRIDIEAIEPLPYSSDTPYAYGNDDGGGNTVGLLLYLSNRFGPVTSFSGTRTADEWNLTIGQLASSLSPLPEGNVDTSEWRSYRFQYDNSWTDCYGDQYVKRTTYDVGRYVGVVLCSPTKYKIFLADELSEEFLNIGDRSGSGQDHCEFIGARGEGNVRTTGVFDAPLVPGYYRSEWGEEPIYGFVGGGVLLTWTNTFPPKTYECGVSIP
ncbi:uncharacterized protein LOC144451072 isoform X2 [Glandiceps talaboti]